MPKSPLIVIVARDEHDHGHDHPHAHDHLHDAAALSQLNRRRLRLVMVFGIAVLLAEVIGGYLSNSLVLYSDAAHMSTDVASIVLAYAAMHIAARPANASKSYGYARAEIVAAFINALALWAITAYFFYEAWQRLIHPPAPNAQIIIVVGAVSLVANVALAAMLHRGSGHNLNVRSAYVHILSDVLGSVAAVVAGVGILFFGAYWLDPAATMLIGVLILVWTWRLTRETLHILLEGTPAAVSPDTVKQTIAQVPGVANVHDLHVWTLTTGQDNLSAHVVLDDATRGPQVVRQIRSRLKDTHGLRHVTIEVEALGNECPGCN